MAWSFAKEQDAYLRSKGWGGTRTDREHHDSFADRDKHIYDSLLKAAGDDKQLTTAEYETIYNDRGPWGRYAYNRDAVANALAQLGSQTDNKLDQDIMDRHDLTYSGNDILQKVEKDWDRGPDSRKRDDFNISWERGIEEDDDAWNVFRWAKNVPEKEKEKEKEPDKPKDPTCPSGTRKGVGGKCIADDDYKKFNKDYGNAGSIDYLTPHMSDQVKPGSGSVSLDIPFVRTSDSSEYKPSFGKGKFSSFLRANQYQQDRSN